MNLTLKMRIFIKYRYEWKKSSNRKPMSKPINQFYLYIPYTLWASVRGAPTPFTSPTRRPSSTCKIAVDALNERHIICVTKSHTSISRLFRFNDEKLIYFIVSIEHVNDPRTKWIKTISGGKFDFRKETHMHCEKNSLFKHTNFLTLTLNNEISLMWFFFNFACFFFSFFEINYNQICMT